MRKGAMLGAIGITLAFAGTAQAVTLVNPQGQPLGGNAQRWADGSRIPTPTGTVALDVSVADTEAICPAGTPSCTGMAYIDPTSGAYLPEIFLTTQAGSFAPQTLLYEMGHAFDFEYLSDADKTWFMRLWKMGLHGLTVDNRWWTGEGSLRTAFSSAGETFAGDYQACALGKAWGFSGTKKMQRRFCAKVRSIWREGPLPAATS